MAGPGSNDEWSGGLTERKLHHKGLYQWLDGEDIDQSAILEDMESM
jgi:hypothetical protein